LVIGGGLMGSAAAWQLSSLGQQVTLIEQQAQNYTEGSSFGNSRISRCLGPKDDIFAYIQQKTVDEVKYLIQFLNEKPSTKPHHIRNIYTNSPVNYLYEVQQIDEVDAICHEAQQVSYKLVKGDEAMPLFGISLPKNYLLLREFYTYSGTLNPEALINKMQLGVKLYGNEIWYQHQVTKVIKKKEKYLVELINHSSKNITTIITDKVVFAAGPYNPHLLKNIAPYFETLIIPKRVSLSFFKIDKARYLQYKDAQQQRIFDSQPLFSQIGQQFFSMIDSTVEDGVPVIKVGLHYARTKVKDLDEVWHQPLNEDEIKKTKTLLFEYLQFLNVPLENNDLVYCNGQVCVYSETSNNIPYTTNLINLETKKVDPNAVVIGGMSGIGAKGCLTYGLLAANLLLGKEEADRLYKLMQLELGCERLMREIGL